MKRKVSKAKLFFPMDGLNKAMQHHVADWRHQIWSVIGVTPEIKRDVLPRVLS